MDHGLTTEVPTVETTGQDGAGTTAMEETTAAAAITVDVDAVTTMAIATITGGESDFLWINEYQQIAYSFSSNQDYSNCA